MDVIKTSDLRNANILDKDKIELKTLIPRALFDINKAVDQVKPILSDIKNYQQDAIYKYTKLFDGVEQNPQNGGNGFLVEESALKNAWDQLDSELKTALEIAAERIRKVHHDQIPNQFSTVLGEGAKVTQRHIPVEKVGLYVPGGLAVYPSSVLMNVIPAQEAGVKELIIASPPQKEYDGQIHPTILAAAYMLGVKNVVAIGGASAVGYFTYMAGVDLITGPGNIFVASAKSLVSGEVGIDSIAGPTEIGIIADKNANPKFVAADLIGQAEHDELAGCVLFTDDAELAKNVVTELNILVENSTHKERIKTALAGQQSGVLLLNSLDECIKMANIYGAEHLEIQTDNYHEISKQIINAGAIFLGNYSPVPLGDYIGGSNHVLPTGGSAAFSSGLSVYTFLKSVQEIEYSEAALNEVMPMLNTIAVDENLPNHGVCAKIRFENN